MSNMKQTINGNSNLFSTSNSILAQALPQSLAAPNGWHSEILDSSISSNIETNFNPCTSDLINTHEEYKTLSTADAPPMIFSSNNETNRIVNQVSSSSQFPTTNINHISSEHRNISTDNRLNEEGNIVLTQEEQNLIKNIDNQKQQPIILHKTPQNNTVKYQQNISVRYLQPPTPPPPEPIIIREVRPPPCRPHSPLRVRQRPPPPCTPPPIVIRERPPPIPPRPASQVIEKLLPPPPRPPRRMIVEHYAPCPPKPPNVVIERWLPYKRSDQRRIFFERVPGPYLPPREPNVLIVHDQAHARVEKEFINQGVTRVDPISYLQQYRTEIDSGHLSSQFGYIVGEAVRALPPPQLLPPTNVHHEYYPHSPHLVSNIWERMKGASPPPYHQHHHLSPVIWDKMKSVPPLPPQAIPYSSNYSSPYPPNYSSPYPSNYPPSYSTHASYSDHLNSSHLYGNQGTYRHDIRPMVNNTPWSRRCESSVSQSHLPSYQFSPPSLLSSAPSPYPTRTIQVKSDAEFQHVLSELTNHNIPPPLRSLV